MPLSAAAETFCELVFEKTPVLVLHSCGHFDVINPLWARYIKEHHAHPRYYLTDLGVSVMREVNDRRQPLIYVGFRFCKDLTFHQAVLNTVSARDELMALRTADGSTPLIGWAWENRSSRVYQNDNVDTMKALIYNEAWWDATNHCGECAREFIL